MSRMFDRLLASGTVPRSWFRTPNGIHIAELSAQRWQVHEFDRHELSPEELEAQQVTDHPERPVLRVVDANLAVPTNAALALSRVFAGRGIPLVRAAYLCLKSALTAIFGLFRALCELFHDTSGSGGYGARGF